MFQPFATMWFLFLVSCVQSTLDTPTQPSTIMIALPLNWQAVSNPYLIHLTVFLPTIYYKDSSSSQLTSWFQSLPDTPTCLSPNHY
uniref:Secreted protein n=1 Tax=Octopus bimaculoides TaxID=37653 RepID=A0A0L8GA20_OCTBM